ncbi:acetate kinase [Catalinimonas alkaloidigena]|uniref:acetate kinase n=1 Tax=Catalinimonas alkaloidigena TaxID=1075417 RepID=UPI00240516B4|nr:acetate kinase [Catalinimonas alkaloidigena]MDF9797560.1 acetate kinase [Catalinimonas alkaloidigena]
MKLLVINTGSSSIKYKLFEMEEKKVMSAGLVEKIGEEQSRIKHQRFLSDGKVEEKTEDLAIKDHRVGLEMVGNLLQDEQLGVIKDPNEIKAVGHRVVHGGSRFSEAVIINAEVKDAIHSLVTLAPLHNPPNLEGIAVAEEVFPQAKQVAVFDTAFHQSMPDYAFLYAIPKKYYQEHRIRVYGMHGTSHQYVAHQAAIHLGVLPHKLNAVSIHLGNGCSMTAIKNGKSVDTSMGLSPLPGLIMGTRSGDIDPAIIFYMGNKLNMSFEEIDRELNKQSGLKGVAGENDMRTIIERVEEGDQEASLALEMYAYRIRKYIGAYLAIAGPLDALIFTAGVGENSTVVREKACQGLEHLGIILNRAKNFQRQKGIQEIQDEVSTVKILVVPTDEELSIAEQTYQLVTSE